MSDLSLSISADGFFINDQFVRVENKTINLEDMLKSFPKKRLSRWENQDGTMEFIDEVAKELNVPRSEVYFKHTVNGYQYGHIRIALKVAAWLSPVFENKVFTLVEHYARDGFVINQTAVAQDEEKYLKLQSAFGSVTKERDHWRLEAVKNRQLAEQANKEKEVAQKESQEAIRKQLILQYIHDLKWNICGFYQIAQSTKAKVKLIDVYPKFKQIVNDLSPKDVEEVVNSVLDILWESEGKPSVHPKFYFEDPLNDGFPTIYQIKRVTDTKELRRRQKLIDDGCL